MPGIVYIDGKPWAFSLDGSVADPWGAGNTNPALEITLPPGVNPINTRPSMASITYGDKTRFLSVGHHCDNIVIDEYLRCYRQGLQAPTLTPTLAAIGGAGTISGTFIGYVSWWDDIGQRRSPLSLGSTPLVLAGSDGRVWGNLPTIPQDEAFYVEGQVTMVGAATSFSVGATDYANQYKVGNRVAMSNALTTWRTVTAVDMGTLVVTVDGNIGAAGTWRVVLYRPTSVTHVELWLSASGDTPRLVERVDIGVTGFSEGKATATFGEAFTDVFEKFPYCNFNIVAYKRQFMCGSPQFPNRIYYSIVNQPEDMEGYLETPGGDAALGLFMEGEVLYCGSNSRIYKIREYTDEVSDLKIDVAEPSIGIISHHLCVNTKDFTIVPSQSGIYICRGGGFVPILTHCDDQWTQDYAAFPNEFETGFGYNNPEERCAYLVVRSSRVFSSGPDDPLVWGQDSQYHRYKADLTGTTPLVFPLPSQAARICTSWVIDYSKLSPSTGEGAELIFDYEGEPGGDGRHNSCAFVYTAQKQGRQRLLIGSYYGYNTYLSEYIIRDRDDVTTSTLSRYGRSILQLSPIWGAQPVDEQFAGFKWEPFWTDFGPYGSTIYTFATAGSGDAYRTGNWEYFGARTVTDNRHILTHPTDRLVGRALVLEFQIKEHKLFNFRGVGGTYTPGDVDMYNTWATAGGGG